MLLVEWTHITCSLVYTLKENLFYLLAECMQNHENQVCQIVLWFPVNISDMTGSVVMSIGM